MKSTGYTLLALSIILLYACNSSGDKNVAQELKKKEKLHVPPNERITCDTLDASFYLPGTFAFSATDTYCVNRAKYFVYEFKHNTDTGINMKITFIDEPGKYEASSGLAQELDHIFAAYPDKKNNWGYLDTVNQFPFVRIKERSPKKNWEADMAFSWVMNKYFSIRITNSCNNKCDTACYRRMIDSVMSSIAFQRTAVEAPAQTAADTPSAQSTQ